MSLQVNVIAIKTYKPVHSTWLDSPLKGFYDVVFWQREG